MNPELNRMANANKTLKTVLPTNPKKSPFPRSKASFFRAADILRGKMDTSERKGNCYAWLCLARL
jgi:hypothetical protein